MVDVGYVDAAQRAVGDNCDTIFINSFADYGIEAMRAVVTVPVSGGGEAAILDAGRDGRRFAIVTVWPQSMAFIYEERLRTVPGGRQCVGVRHVSPEEELAKLGTRDGVQERMARIEESIIARLVDECERAAREDGAECVVLGCTCMAPVGPAIAARCSVPIIESARAGYHAAMRALTERVPRSSPVLTKRPTLVPSLVDAAIGGADKSVATSADECAVCII